MSTKVTRILWTVQTGHNWWSGTDTRISIEIYRDGDLLKRLSLEPGNTPRLDKDTNVTYYWVFQSPDNIGVSVSGTTIPYYEEFREGIAGHLKVKLIARGDDAWEKQFIDSTVVSGELVYIPDTIDSFTWQDRYDRFYFGQDVVLSTDSGEGHTAWTLAY
jgi:hypothetical protein